jgi:hypothetical protein
MYLEEKELDFCSQQKYKSNILKKLVLTKNQFADFPGILVLLNRTLSKKNLLIRDLMIQ